MSTFIDRHPLTSVASTTRYQLYQEVVAGVRDVSGVLTIGHWVEDGSIYCVLDAPDTGAVCRHHVARGLACDDVHPIETPMGRPLTGNDRLRLQAEIARIWHPKQAPRPTEPATRPPEQESQPQA